MTRMTLMSLCVVKGTYQKQFRITYLSLFLICAGQIHEFPG